MLEHRPGGPFLHDSPPVEHDQPLAEAAGHRQVVGHEDQAQAQAALQLPQQGQHLGLHFGIEHAHALVAEQHLRLQHQGAGDGHPLLLAPGELTRQAVLVELGRLQPHGGQPFAGPGSGFGAAGQTMDQQRIRHRFPHRHARIEAGQRILKHHLQAAASPGQLRPAHPEQVAALQAHAAAPHRRQTHQGTAEGALAAA